MGLFRKSLIISFKEKSIFRFDYLVGTVFAFFYIVLKVSLWKGLYGAEGTEIGGIALNSMIAYSIIAGFTEGVTKTSVMKELNDSVVDGTISGQLLLPMGLRKYLFIRSLTRGFSTRSMRSCRLLRLPCSCLAFVSVSGRPIWFCISARCVWEPPSISCTSFCLVPP